jgi:hypothetical protein
MLNAKGKGKGLNLAKKKITSITDQRRSAIPQMDQEIVEDLTELEQQDREINNQRHAKQFTRIEAVYEFKNKDQYIKEIKEKSKDETKKSETSEKKGFSFGSFFKKKDPKPAVKEKSN